MEGLYTTSSESSFKSAEEIKAEALRTEYRQPQFSNTKAQNPDYGYWSGRYKNRQEEFQKTTEQPKPVEVEFYDDTLVTFMADLHIGGEHTDYKRIEDEVNAVVKSPNPNTGVFLLGDLIDAFAFNPAQFGEIEQTPEQINYARSLVQHLDKHGKLLGVWNGNHDAWVKKYGFDPYTYILEGINVPYMHGIGYVTAKIGEEKYNIAGNHMFKGSSMYNPTHPQRRAINEGARGADIVVSGHWHDKGISQIPMMEFGGESRITTLIALGTYKATDEYIRTYGFSNRDPKSMYGVSILLSKDGKAVYPYFDILKAHGEFNRIQPNTRR